MNEKISMKKSIKLFFYGNRLMIDASKSKYFILIFLSIFGGVTSPINALIWEKFLDRLVRIDGGIKIEFIDWYYLVMLSIMPFLGYIINIFLQYIKQTYSDQMNLFITERVLGKALELPMEKYDDSSVYNDMNIAITRTTQNCMGLLDSITEIIYYLVQIMSFIIILLYFDWKIIVLSVLGALPALYVSIQANKHWFNTLNSRIEKLRHIDYLKGLLIKNEYIKETRLYNMGNKILTYIKKCFNSFILEDAKARKLISAKKTLVQFFDEIITFVVKIWILVLSISQHRAVGSIVLYFNSHESLKSSLMSFLSELAKIQDNILYLQILERVDKLEVVYKNRCNKDMPPFEKIEFRNVSFSYPGQNRPVIKNVSLVFEKGRTYSIVGLNGAGKTTLLKLLLGLYEPVTGEILLNGVRLNDINIASYYLHISAVFQDFIKYPFTIEGNISTDLDKASEENVYQSIKYACLEDMIKKLPNGIKTILMREWNGGIELSQGQWQKIAIARCFYRQSDIMILDEPFSSIDIESENYIVKNIKRFGNKKMNIFITHHFSSISMADKVIVMDDGKVIEQGTHDELIQKKGKYFELYSEQLETLKKVNAC